MQDTTKFKDYLENKYVNVRDWILYGELKDVKIKDLENLLNNYKRSSILMNERNNKLSNKLSKILIRLRYLERQNIDLEHSVNFHKNNYDALLTKHTDIHKKYDALMQSRKETITKELTKTFRKIKRIKFDINPNIKTDLINIFNKLKSIKDIINLEQIKTDDLMTCKKFDKLIKVIPALKELDKMVGLTKIKEQIFKHICYFIQELNNSNELMNIVIYGEPGVGKTELGKIISKIYLALGFLKNNKIIYAKRSELVGMYLGHTAVQTQKVIDNAIGGVLFIDEAYSLGNKELRDSFSKECIDTLNQNLTEHKGEFLCIIAGYEKEINECFFKYNNGLERRFPIRYNIEGYDAEELREMTIRHLSDWKLKDDTVLNIQFFKDNHKNFKFYGGDVELLIQNAKFIASERMMHTDIDVGDKTFIQLDFDLAMNEIVKSREHHDTNDVPMFMFS